MNKRPTRRPLPFLACLALAGGLLSAHLLGCEPAFDRLLERLAVNERFVAAALALELGPQPIPVTLHAPAAAASALPVSVEADKAPESPPPAAEAVSFTAKAESVEVFGPTKLDYDVAELLRNPLELRKTVGPQVLIVHTHGSEAYTNDENYRYVSDERYRTTDTRYNVVAVGDRLAEVLNAAGIETIHCRTMFDSPAYNGSYGRSLTEIERQLAENPSIQVVIDLHRDDIALPNGGKKALLCTVGGEDCAQLMFVVGSNESGLRHDNWLQNLNWAVNLQAGLDATYPDLMRPVNLRRQRFNQHLRPGSVIIECGSSGNTLTQALRSIELFGGYLAAELSAQT